MGKRGKADGSIGVFAFKNKVTTPLFFVFFAIFGCQTRDSYESLLTEEQASNLWFEVARPDLPQDEQIRNLSEIRSKSEKLSNALGDLDLALQAEKAEGSGDFSKARSIWLAVLRDPKTLLGETALDRWVRLRDKESAGDLTADDLANEILAATGNGQDSVWLMKNRLAQLERMSAKIKGKLKLSKQAGSAEQMPTPDKRHDDPFWEDSAIKTCGKSLSPEWALWRSKLVDAERNYWDGLSLICQRKYREGSEYLKLSLDGLRSKKGKLLFYFNALEDLILAQRKIGNRDEVASLFKLQFAEYWSLEYARVKSSWSEFEYYKRRVESGLWVARTQALKGDFEESKNALNLVLEVFGQARVIRESLGIEKRQLLDELRVEAYHIFATRVCYELGDFGGAYNFIKLAQSVEGVSDEWKMRLLWSSGWLLYRSQNLSQASAIWRGMLGDSPSESYRPRLLYWIGRASSELGSQAEAKDYFSQLAAEYPLSFYTIIGLARVDKNYRWQDNWASSQDMRQRTFRGVKFDLGQLKVDAQLETLLLRVEACLKSGTKSWQPVVASDLFAYISGRPKLLSHFDFVRYVALLLNLSGNHHQAITLLSQASQNNSVIWKAAPELLWSYFPQPFWTHYQSASRRNGLDLELAYAISRQESSFNPKAVSPADAYGLMQLILPTAMTQAERSGLKWIGHADDLKDPGLNVDLGVGYLGYLGRRYGGRWYQAFAAYNAGEYVVDSWQARRSGEDPMVWVEGISFAETAGYVKNVWRNWEVYKFLASPPRPAA